MIFRISVLCLLLLPIRAGYKEQAEEVTRYIENKFSIPRSDLYRRGVETEEPDFMWGNGVMFSALCGAAHLEPKIYAPKMLRFYKAMEVYWDNKAKIPAYEPAPTQGNGNDKYYDDNAWMVITFLEAYDLTKYNAYAKRAKEVQEFVWSGYDEVAGGGIWWHEQHKGDSKNTCSNGPGAVGAYLLAEKSKGKDAEKWLDAGDKIIDWTVRNLRRDDFLYSDAINVNTKVVNHAALTYNTALMIRAMILRAELRKDEFFMKQAMLSADAADHMLDSTTKAYRDPIKWAHLMVEADIIVFQKTKQQKFLTRASNNVDYHYATWKKQAPNDLISNASLARELWLLADRKP